MGRASRTRSVGSITTPLGQRLTGLTPEIHHRRFGLRIGRHKPVNWQHRTKRIRDRLADRAKIVAARSYDATCYKNTSAIFAMRVQGTAARMKHRNVAVERVRTRQVFVDVTLADW